MNLKQKYTLSIRVKLSKNSSLKMAILCLLHHHLCHNSYTNFKVHVHGNESAPGRMTCPNYKLINQPISIVG